MPGVGEFIGVDAEFDAGVGAERVACGELFGDLAGKVVADAAVLEQAGEFVEFGLWGGGEFFAFDGEGRLFRVSLGADGDVLLTAIDSEPAMRPTRPAVNSADRESVAPATPTTMPAVETTPSLVPRTAARSQFRRVPSPSWCGSPVWCSGPVSGGGVAASPVPLALSSFMEGSVSPPAGSVSGAGRTPARGGCTGARVCGTGSDYAAS